MGDFNFYQSNILTYIVTCYMFLLLKTLIYLTLFKRKHFANHNVCKI